MEQQITEVIEKRQPTINTRHLAAHRDTFHGSVYHTIQETVHTVQELAPYDAPVRRTRTFCHWISQELADRISKIQELQSLGVPEISQLSIY
jgi:hypothetical protein